MIETTTFQPEWVSPPGDTIEDLIDELGWSQAELATRLEFSRKHVNDLINGRATITAPTATKLARVLGSTEEFWLAREAQYRVALERQEAIKKAAEDADWLKEVPSKWMASEGWIPKCFSKGSEVLELFKFFGVVSVEAWRQQYSEPLVAFRASDKFSKHIGPVSAWIRQAEKTAHSIDCEPFNSAGFKALVGELRALTNETNPEVFTKELVQRCAAQGVAVVFVPAPKGCPASGATRWLTPTKAMLVLSLRHKTHDHLWFTFFHEAAHLILHGKKMLFVDGLDGLDGLDEEKEKEADRFACDLLIPPRDASELKRLAASGRFSKDMVRAFASRIGIAPGIVVGRMQNEEWIPWKNMNDLKVRYEWGKSTS